MEAPHLLLELSHHLIRAGLPAAYIRESISELQGHLDETEGLVESLGAPEQLAARYVDNYRQATFCGRNPWTTLVAGGFLVTHLCWTLTHLGLACLLVFIMELQGAHFFGTDPTNSIPFEWLLTMQVGMCVANLLAFALTTWCMTRLARTSGRGPYGLAAALFWPVLVSACGRCIVNPPGAGEAGCLLLAWGIGPEQAQIQTLYLALYPLLLALFFARHDLRWRCVAS